MPAALAFNESFACDLRAATRRRNPNRSRLDDCVAAKIIAVRLLALSIALAFAASGFGQQKPEAAPRDTGSDLLWKKLERRV